MDPRDPRVVSEALEALGAFGAASNLGVIPDDVASHGKLVLLDTMGVALAGSAEPEPTKLAALALREGGNATATILRTGLPRTSTQLAALVNGTAGVWLELDPGHRLYRTHAPAHVLPAALAVAESLHSSGAELLAAFVLGCEVAYRLGAATHPRPEVNAHGTWAAVGTAAAVARLHDCDRQAFATVLALASHLALATTFRASPEGATVRNAYVGISAELAIQANWLADAGFTGLSDAPAEVFGTVLGQGFAPAALTEGLGVTYTFVTDYAKIHACCHHLIPAIEALGAILDSNSVDARDIEEITVATYQLASRFAASAPANALAAKFSIPYVLAARIVVGNVGMDAFAPIVLADAAVQAIAARVSVREDPVLSARYPVDRGADVVVRTRDGRSFHAFRANPDGDFRHPLSANQRHAKFEALAGRALRASTVSLLAEDVARLDTVADVAVLMDTLREREATSARV